jgi:hypothetical protein
MTWFAKPGSVFTSLSLSTRFLLLALPVEPMHAVPLFFSVTEDLKRKQSPVFLKRRQKTGPHGILISL